MKIAENTGKIDVINGLRGIAIVAVLYQHTIFSHYSKLLIHPYIVGNGWLGVNLFFILSGFVLYKPYFLQYRNFSSSADVLEFYKHRYLRIYPLFVFVCIISSIFLTKISPRTIRILFETLSTFSMVDSKQFFPDLNPVYWSLLLEIWFSIFFPLIFFSFSKYGFKRTTIFVFIVSFLFRFAGGFYTGFSAYNINPLKDCVFARIDDFVLGMLICKFFYEKNKVFAINNVLLIVFSIVFIIAGCLVWDEVNNLGVFKEVMMAISNNFIQVGLFLLIIIALKPNNWVHRFFRIGFLQLLGMMCFSLYSWHILITRSFNFWNGFTILKMISFYAFTFIISALSYRYIEFGSEKDWRKLFNIKPRKV
ncbi:MAG: acyltransferase [Bacteroidota bacterium]